jgi:hypothetical protein
MSGYDEMRKKGFRDVCGLLIGIDDKEMYRYCMENRLLLRRCYEDIDELMRSKERFPVVIKELGIDGYEREFIIYKVRLVREIILIDGKINPLIEYISKREREYRSEIMQKKKNELGERGGYIGGFVPYGYYHKDKKLYIDDYESFVVKFVFYRYSQGCSCGGIAKELTLRGFKNRNGNPFRACSVQNIIDNKRLYQGYRTYKGMEVKGEHKGILEDSERLLTEEWKNRVFDAQTEARIM